jgi:stress response protein YsnF
MNYSLHDRHYFNSLIDKLKAKLRNFLVVNRQGERLGIVKDLIVDRQRQLQIIISPTASHPTSSLQLNSKQIEKIEIVDKIVVVNPQPASNNASTENLTSESGREQSLTDSSKTASDRADTSAASQDPFMPSEPLAPKAMTHETEHQAEMQFRSEPDLPDEIIKLLSERVVVERKKRKVGEAIVRKEIETRIVEVPVRYEKLVIEQVTPERKQIIEINLGQETLTELESELAEAANGKQHNLAGTTVSGSFSSPKIASLLLNAIARERQHGCQQIRIEIVVDSPEKQKTYQEWFARCSQ